LADSNPLLMSGSKGGGRGLMPGSRWQATPGSGSPVEGGRDSLYPCSLDEARGVTDATGATAEPQLHAVSLAPDGR